MGSDVFLSHCCLWLLQWMVFGETGLPGVNAQLAVGVERGGITTHARDRFMEGWTVRDWPMKRRSAILIIVQVRYTVVLCLI